MIEEINKKDILILVIVAIVYAFGVYIGITTIDIEKQNQDSYIQNLEEKLNIYEEDYDNFCLRDSLSQEY